MPATAGAVLRAVTTAEACTAGMMTSSSPPPPPPGQVEWEPWEEAGEGATATATVRATCPIVPRVREVPCEGCVAAGASVAGKPGACISSAEAVVVAVGVMAALGGVPVVIGRGVPVWAGEGVAPVVPV